MRFRSIPPAVAFTLLSVACASAESRRVLYEGRSPYNTIVVTEDKQGLRYLQFARGGSLQSVVRPGAPRQVELAYARGAMTALAYVAAPARVLIVGLGGGTMPMFLRSLFPRAHIDVVDIDPEVVKVSKRFFGFKEDAHLRAHVTDGRRYIEESPGGYDLILLDAYGPDSIPYHLATREFLEAVRRALSERGVVAANVWAAPNPLYDEMLRTYRETFPSVQLLELAGSANRIVFALPRSPAPSQGALVERGRALSREHKLKFDLGALLLAGLSEVDPSALAGTRILVDADAPTPQQPARQAQ